MTDHPVLEPHAYVPSGHLQHSLIEGMEYEPCGRCWLPKEDEVHADVRS